MNAAENTRVCGQSWRALQHEQAGFEHAAWAFEQSARDQAQIATGNATAHMVSEHLGIEQVAEQNVSEEQMQLLAQNEWRSGRSDGTAKNKLDQ